MLDALGIGSDLESVYRALLVRPSASAAQLAGVLALAEPDVDKVLAALADCGLAARMGDGDYVAAPPAMALGAMIAERRDGLRLAEQALVTLAEQHRVASAGRMIGELFEVVTGVDAIRQRYGQVQHAARTELRTFITAPFVAVPPGENTAEPAAIDRGVRFRGVVERSVLAEPGAMGLAADSGSLPL